MGEMQNEYRIVLHLAFVLYEKHNAFDIVLFVLRDYRYINKKYTLIKYIP